MNDRKALLKAIKESPFDTETRSIYADWLEEHDEPEEADRQRKWVSSYKWMREFASKHHAYGKHHNFEEERKTGLYKGKWPIECPVDETIDEYYRDFMEFLTGHREGHARSFSFDLPYDFNAYSDEMWEHFEVLSGLSSPKGKYRKEMPPMSCAC